MKAKCEHAKKENKKIQRKKQTELHKNEKAKKALEKSKKPESEEDRKKQLNRIHRYKEDREKMQGKVMI